MTTHTHPDITSPPLRRRMAQALNNLRHRWPFFYRWGGEETLMRRDVVKLGVLEMARLEQELDDAQDERILTNLAVIRLLREN